MSTAPTHPPDLGFKTDTQLRDQGGYRRDEIGQVRSPTGELVCGLSGRVGSIFLLPHPIPLPGGERAVIWIHRDAARDLGKGLRARVGSALGGFLRRMADMGVRAIIEGIGK